MVLRQYNIMMRCMLAILLSALFASCKDEIEEAEDIYRPSRIKGLEIGFKADQDGFEIPTTRAVINSVSDLQKLYVLSMRNDGTGWKQVFKNSTGTSGIDVLTLTNNGKTNNGEIWDYSPVAKWENGNNYKFRAFFPKSSTEFKTSDGESCPNGFQYDLSSGSTKLTLSNYTGARNPRNSTDILVSSEIDRPYASDANNDVVALKMKHLMSGVNFRIRTKKGTPLHIKNFKIIGYARYGSCVIDNVNVWNLDWKEKLKMVNGQTVEVPFTYSNNNNKVTKDQTLFLFKDKTSNAVMSTNDVYNYLHSDDYYNKREKFYVIPTSDYDDKHICNIGGSDIKGDKEDTDYYEVSTYQGLLFIPQELDRESVKVNMNFKINQPDWSQENTFLLENVSVQHLTYGEIEFYFGNTDPGAGKRLFATLDLTANGKVHKWEAGTKYNYTISIFEYQATADIYVEDWAVHSYEEELK